MNQTIAIVAIAAVLGSAVVGGIFFAFSSFVMKALAGVPASEGIAAMQSINVVVINPSFLGAFMGTAALSLGLGSFALVSRSHPSALYFLVGAFFYLGGTVLVTMLGNVPLNDQLAAAGASDPAAVGLWEHYLDRWVMWNHVRTAAAIIAGLLFLVGLLRSVPT